MLTGKILKVPEEEDQKEMVTKSFFSYTLRTFIALFLLLAICVVILLVCFFALKIVYFQSTFSRFLSKTKKNALAPLLLFPRLFFCYYIEVYEFIFTLRTAKYLFWIKKKNSEASTMSHLQYFMTKWHCNSHNNL